MCVCVCVCLLPAYLLLHICYVLLAATLQLYVTVSALLVNSRRLTATQRKAEAALFEELSIWAAAADAAALVGQPLCASCAFVDFASGQVT